MNVRIWVNGQRVDDKPVLSPIDHGVTVGDGAFETAKVDDSRIFALDAHHDRMDRTLSGLGLEKLDRARVSEGIAAVLNEPLAFGRLRYTITGGIGPLGSDRGDAEPTYIVTAAEISRPAPTTKIATIRWTRNENSAIAGLKTTSYAENVVALQAAHQTGASEAIFANTLGNLCEGTGSNIFVVTGGRVITPPLQDGPLAGITRGFVIAWAREAGLDVAEEPIGFETLTCVDEVFITSSTRDVQGVHAVDDHQLSEEGVPGEITQQVAAVFAQRSEELFSSPAR